MPKNAVFLAPMEGVTDHPMREVMSHYGGINICVTEFIRVSNSVLPPKVFKKDVPELARMDSTPGPLHSGPHTQSGTPVVVQLLGGDSDRLLSSALNAVKAGATRIDINFGCPAPTVNRNDGGASLLKDPARMGVIVQTLRQGLPKEISLSAKLRLGWDSTEAIEKNCEILEKSGADWITIHARTRMQAYQPPVFWEKIAAVRKHATVPIVANGDIWSLDDFRRCRDITGCDHYMLGRPLLANPGLGRKIFRELKIADPRSEETHDFEIGSPEWIQLLNDFINTCSRCSNDNAQYALPRLKQWAVAAIKHRGFKSWEPLKRCQTTEEFIECVQSIRS